MEGLILLVLIAGAVAVGQLWRRTTRLEAEIARLHDRLIRLDTGTLAAAPPDPRPHATIARPAPRPIDSAAAIGPPQPEPPPRARVTLPSLEDLIGGRLLIWVGAAALVVAAFFLVRYSIESGLLGPAARALIAAGFAALLIAASEAARRLPAFAGDPRVAQALAGAGVASAYGTLYLAAAVYDLIGALPAFALMLVVTGIGLALALRHGPPTAVMALAGGFLAPLVAGFDAAGIGPLLIYLGLFIAALFALATHRRWPWLAIAATAAGFAWTGFLIAAVDGGQVAAVGAFVILLAIAATLALPVRKGRWSFLRLAPLTLGLVQLLSLAPILDFGPLAWSFYLTIAAASLFLAWRDPRLLPAAPIALALCLLLLGIALAQPEARVTPLAAILATLLFAVPGHLLSRQSDVWAWLALGGSAGPLLVANLVAPWLLPAFAWFGLAMVASALLASLAWRHRDRIGRADTSLVGGTAFAALIGLLGIGQIVAPDLIVMAVLVVMAGLILTSRRLPDPDLARLPLLPLVVATVAALGELAVLPSIVFESLAGEALPFALLGDPVLLLAILAAPAALAIAWPIVDRAAFGAWRRPALYLAGTVAIACVYVALKLPLSIDTPRAFLDWGFAERALITHAFLATGWLLARRNQRWAGQVLLGIGLFRIVWFDLLFLTPLAIPQAVGPLPLANLAVLHHAGAAAWFASLATARDRRIAMALTLVAVLALVRQATHGTLLTGPVTTSENWGYSAALLLLAIGWMWRGIAAGSADLRRGGLGLLVAVTLKISVIDAAQLGGVLRILSFLGLGIALIGIHWLYNRFLRPLAGSVPNR